MVRSGAVDVARGKVFLLGLVVLHLGGLVLFRPGPAHDVETDQVAQQDRLWPGQHQVDRVVVDLLDLVDAGDVDLHRALRLTDAVEAEHHVVRRERRAVVELDATPQLEAHLGRADQGPLDRQRGLGRVAHRVARQPLVAVGQDGVGGRMVLRVRV